ncbi:MAG: DUF368 domain-containing protein [Planctomycetaceae bacterium]|nr:MAG: DUF368 domain-containing protein [Planctomycetaceae bacterium]
MEPTVDARQPNSLPPATDTATQAPDAAGDDRLCVGVVGSSGGDLINFFRGFCMGAADTVPGVSGGTIALILGHYQRLLSVFARLDSAAIRLLVGRQWGDLWRYADLRFVLALLAGILVGAASVANAMHWLLEHRTAETYAVFFGLVLASGWVVFRWIERWSAVAVIVLVAGTAVSYAIAGVAAIEFGTGRGYLFLAAAIAICAMILPGISGAFVLLLLGMYHPVIEMIKRFARLDWSVGLLIDLSTFAAGCLVGLLLFSRLLRWCLRAHPDTTLAALLGLMIGSSRRVWPLQQPTEATAELAFKFQQWERVPPSDWPGQVWPLVLLAAIAAIVVIGVERTAERLAGGSKEVT